MFDAAPPAIGGACRADGTWEFGRKASCPNQKAAEKPFKTRLVDLPDETRMLLLIAALNDRESTGEILQAAAFAVGRGIDLDGLEPPLVPG